MRTYCRAIEHLTLFYLLDTEQPIWYLLNVWRHLWGFGDTSLIVSEHAKTVLSHGVRYLSTAWDWVPKTEIENRMILTKNDL